MISCKPIQWGAHLEALATVPREVSELLKLGKRGLQNEDVRMPAGACDGHIKSQGG